MNDAQAVKALGALAQDTRLRLFRHLVAAGPEGATPGQMAEALHVAATLVSFHMKELGQAGLASQYREGRHVIYRASIDTIGRLAAFLTDNCRRGEPCLGAAAPERGPAPREHSE